MNQTQKNAILHAAQEIQDIQKAWDRGFLGIRSKADKLDSLIGWLREELRPQEVETSYADTKAWMDYEMAHMLK